MDTTTEIKHIDHLGLVAAVCDEAGIVDLINEYVGKAGRTVSVGHAVKAMVLNALGFTARALYLTPMFYTHRPVQLLIGDGIGAENLNESSLGTALDAIYDAGITELFFHVASQIFARYGIPIRWGHLDSTTFSLYGDYDPSEDDMDACPIEITKGFSKDSHPELNQVVLQIISANKSTLPIWIEVLSGNTSDRKSFVETIRQFQKQFDPQDMPTMVMDSAFYSEENITSCSDISWITRVPETLNEIKALYATIDRSTFTPLEDGYAIYPYTSTYGGVPQRWLVVFSEQARTREIATLNKRIAKIEEKQEKAFMHLRNRTFSCADDAREAGELFAKGLKYQNYTPEVIERARHAGRGRPKAGAEPTHFEYHLAGTLVRDDETIAAAEAPKGLFVIATNVLDPSVLSDEQLLATYKDQAVTVERGFRFLKDPLFYAESLYLKSPKRIMALLMVMTLSLLIYSLAERNLRQALKDAGTHVWDQKRKPSNNPTLRWVFQNFAGLSFLVTHSRDGTTMAIQNVGEFHLRVLRSMGSAYEKIYFSG
jgi:transposase